MANPLFSKVAVKRAPRSMFNLSHEKKLSCNMGDLIPAYIQDVIPGDSFNVRTEMLMRLAPLVFPLMHRVNVYMHYFFVPNRLVFTGWEDFITGGRLGTDATVFPTIEIVEGNKVYLYKGTLADYMGIPITASGTAFTQNPVFSALPFRAYLEIYNEYYRDQNLTDEVTVSKGSTLAGGDLEKLVVLRKRAWEKDYFTSALPWAQRGVAATIAPTIDYSDVATASDNVGALYTTSGDIKISSGADGHIQSSVSDDIGLHNIDGISIDINDLRTAERVQRWLEKNARFGSRYIEQILGHFGVQVPDHRVQRPEFLGGFKQPVVVSEVLASLNDANNDLGDMAGHGISVGSSNGFSKTFTEHGYILGIMSILPRTAYQQGIEKHLLKTDKFDFAFPEFANLGEQPVEQQELYFDYGGTDKADTFGYQSRYAEYKFKNSSVHGDFKDNLKAWHLGRIFTDAPELNEEFIEADPDHRVFAVTTSTVHKLYCQLYHDVKAVRPLPQWGIPTI